MMSHTDSHAELASLLSSLVDGSISPPQFERLGQILETDSAARAIYRDHLSVHARLHWRWHQAVPGTQRELMGDEVGSTITDELPIQQDDSDALASSLPPVIELSVSTSQGLGGLTTATHGVFGYLSSGWPVAYLVATVILGIGLVVGAVTQLSPPEHFADTTLPIAGRHFDPTATMLFVGRITGIVDCKWADPKTEAYNGANVPLGRKYALTSGLMEITYDTGAKVILQGPVTYEVESASGGYLSVGKLTARVEKKGDNLPSPSGGGAGGEGGQENGNRNESQSALTLTLSQGERGPDSRSSFLIPHSYFFVRTPTATVTDLGTEFGVEVDTQGSTTSHVFRGSVQVQVRDADGKTQGTGEVLRENESARVENMSDPDGGNRVIALNRSAESVNFVREISKRASKRSDRFELIAYWQFGGDDFLADSSGHGHTLVNSGAKQVDSTALFNGASMMRTDDSIDLTPYTKVRVSWRQKTVSADFNQIIWEQSCNYNELAGAITAYIDAGQGHAAVYVPEDSCVYNIDEYSVQSDTWEHFAIEYDRTAKRARVVRVFRDGREVATVATHDAFPPKSFIRAAFHIGARDGLKCPFVGQIDNLKIEGEAAAPSQ